MTGASHRLRQLLDRFGPDLRLFRDQVEPKVKKLRDLETKWTQLSRTLTIEQREHMEQYGYAPMTHKQIKMAYDGKEADDERNAKEFLRQLKGKLCEFDFGIEEKVFGMLLLVIHNELYLVGKLRF